MAAQKGIRKPQRPAARLLIKPVPKRAARTPKKSLQNLLTSLNRTRTSLVSRIKRSSGKVKAELTTAYGHWRRRALIVERNLRRNYKGAADAASMLIAMGSFLVAEQSRSKRFQALIPKVNKYVKGRAENKTLITGKINEALVVMPKVRTSILAYLRRPTAKSFNEASKHVNDYDQKAGLALSYYGAALEFQARHRAVVKSSGMLRNEILRNLRIVRGFKAEMYFKEGEKIWKQLNWLYKSVREDGLVRPLEKRLKNYKLADVVQEKKGLISFNPRYWKTLQATERFLKKKARMFFAISWQVSLTKSVHDYYRMSWDKEKQAQILKKIKALIAAGKTLLRHEIKNVPKYVQDPEKRGGLTYMFGSKLLKSMTKAKRDVLAKLKELERIILRKGRYAKAENAMFAVSNYNYVADEIIKDTIHDQMEEHFDKRSWWQKHKDFIADVAVVGLGVVASAISGGFASPFVLAAEAAYFAARGTLDMIGRYMMTKRLPGVFEVLGAAAMVIAPAGRAARGIIALRGARALRGELRLALRGAPAIERRIVAELALKETRTLRYITLASDISAKYLLGYAAVGIIRDPSLENLLHNAVFFAMGAGHGLTARLQRRTIARYAKRIEAANAALTSITKEAVPSREVPAEILRQKPKPAARRKPPKPQLTEGQPLETVRKITEKVALLRQGPKFNVTKLSDRNLRRAAGETEPALMLYKLMGEKRFMKITEKKIEDIAREAIEKSPKDRTLTDNAAIWFVYKEARSVKQMRVSLSFAKDFLKKVFGGKLPSSEQINKLALEAYGKTFERRTNRDWAAIWFNLVYNPLAGVL